MTDKPDTAAGYSREDVSRVKATCLYAATKLGDLMDETVVIGGLVPSLLVDQEHLPRARDPHVGTVDLDMGLALGLVKSQRYHELAERLRRAGFAPDRSESGKLTRQRWGIGAGEGGQKKVTLDFLIPPRRANEKGGTLRNLEKDFAAVITPGLQLAFLTRKKVRLTGKTLYGEDASRDVWVCGVGAYVVLKLLAFDNRGENKDAYDLYYILRNYGEGPGDVAKEILPILRDHVSERALEILKRDFLNERGTGPGRVVKFLGATAGANIRADVVGDAAQFIAACGK
jgi:hypothetical protein